MRFLKEKRIMNISYIVVFTYLNGIQKTPKAEVFFFITGQNQKNNLLPQLRNFAH